MSISMQNSILKRGKNGHESKLISGVYLYLKTSRCIMECMYICMDVCIYVGLPWWLSSKKSRLSIQETQVRSLGWEDPLEKEMATHSSILAWKIPWTVEGVQSMALQELDATE